MVEYLVGQEGFVHYSVRGFLLEEMKKLGMPENRDSMTVLANRLRAAYGPSHIIDHLYDQASENGHDCVIESIRTPGEVESLRRKPDFYLLAVDADPRTRYDRIRQRASETDQVSFEEFRANEEREFNSEDPHKQNLSKCIEMADFTFRNDGSIEELTAAVEKVMNEIKTSIANDKQKD